MSNNFTGFFADMLALPFEACSIFTIAGATKSGKMSWVYNKMFTEPVQKVMYCYGFYQPVFDKMSKNVPNISFHEGLPGELDSFVEGSEHSLIILDDLMDLVLRETKKQQLFTQGAHHLRLSVLFITHNCFQQGKCSRTISLNTHYLILF